MTNSAQQSLQTMKDILDIEDIYFTPLNTYLLVIASVLATIALGMLLYFFIKKWRNRIKTKPEKILKPHEYFYQSLQFLDLKKLLENHEYKKHYFELSEIFRVYLDHRFEYPAQDKTTAEIVPALINQLHLSAELANQATVFLYQSDLIKFAKTQPTVEQIASHRQALEQFVEQTKNLPDEMRDQLERDKEH